MTDIIDLRKIDRSKHTDRITPTKLPYCSCKQLEAHELDRCLYCEKCGRRHEAFDYVLKLASRQSRLIYSIRDMTEEASNLAKEITDLKKTRTRLKSAIRKAEALARQIESTPAIKGRLSRRLLRE